MSETRTMFKHGGTTTGRMSSPSPAPQTLLKPAVVIVKTALDIDLLDPLAQPTLFERARRRDMAALRYLHFATRGAERRLMNEGHPSVAEAYLEAAQQYMALYQFTQEELDGCST